MINLHLLRIFVTVVEHRSFSRAAKALYISQPGVSKAVRELETQLDVSLIDRSIRIVTLTEAGAILYDHAQKLFAIEHDAEAALEQLHDLQRGQLAIGASQTVGTYLLPPVLGRYHQQYPAIKLSLQVNNTQRIIEELRSLHLDVAVVEGPVDHHDLILTRWRTDRLVVIASPQHPLAQEDRVFVSQLADYPYIQREQGSGTRSTVEQALRELNLDVNPALEVGSNQTVKQAVIADLGISVVSEATIELERSVGALAVIDLVDFEFSRPLTQVTIANRPPSRALSAFLTLLHS